MNGRKIVISFIPVIHRGYLDFLAKSGTRSVCVVEASDVPELPHLARELRALQFEEVQKILAVFGLRILRFAEAKAMIKESEVTLIMPDEDVSRVLYEKHFQGRKIEFVPTFLRWDWDKSTGHKGATIPNADRVIRKGDTEMGGVLPHMNLLLEARERSSDWWRQIAAMAVCEDNRTTIVAYNSHLPNEYVPYIDGDPRNNFGPGEFVEIYTSLHAEDGVVAHAAREGIKLKGADMFVTTFPCSRCANSIVAAGIRRIFFAGGYSNLNGVKTLRDHDVELVYVEL